MNGHSHKNSKNKYFVLLKSGCKKTKTYLMHRFIWECYNGLIPNGKVIFHKNRNYEDNRLKNLELATTRDIMKEVHDPKKSTKVKPVKAINCTTKVVSYYRSMYAAGKKLGIDGSLVKKV